MQQGQMNPAQLAEMLKSAKDMICENCNCIFFKQVIILKKVSKVIAATPDDVVIPIPIYRCDDCGTPIMNNNDNKNDKKEPSTLITSK